LKTTSALHVAFSLASSAPATIELIDLAGRRVHAEAISEPTPGPRTLRLMPGRALSPGIYWARLEQGEHRNAIKVLVLQ